MQPTAAPWAKRETPGDSSAQVPLPALSAFGATRGSGSAAALSGRPVQAAIRCEPRFPTPVDLDRHTFTPAVKRITSPDLLRHFLSSAAAQDFLAFVLALNDAIKGHALSDRCLESEATAALVGVLDTLRQWVEEAPAAPHSMRYGNPAFRMWLARVKGAAPTLLAAVLPPALRRAEVLRELGPYLADSFGNETRIDYGTGHETAFAALLFCLARLGVLHPVDAQALVSRVFAAYLALMRRVQTTYWLEPAGSHGVWGLDDYQFLPFLWGSAQLVEHPYLKPADALNTAVLQAEGEEYLYLGGVRFAQLVKKGPLAETSPLLCDIAAVPSWSKVNSGLAKMYQAEVLGKLPIMQHFLFGSLLSYPEQGGADEQRGTGGGLGPEVEMAAGSAAV